VDGGAVPEPDAVAVQEATQEKRERGEPRGQRE